MKLREKEELIRRLTGDIERLRQRATQFLVRGTVQEQALDQRLTARFPSDDIRRVARGRAGGDVVHHVRSHNGTVIGTILWESKRATSFVSAWVPTLKANAHKVRADVAVLVSSVVSDGAEIATRDGVWVVSLRLADAVAELLRNGLLTAAQARTSAELRDELAGGVYDYMTSPRFQGLVMGALQRLRGS